MSRSPLRVAALIKQVPAAESMTLGPDGRLVRTGVPFEMNPYCRRAVAAGVTLAGDTGGTCTVITLGPPSAEDVLREALAWGADSGIHLCDAAFEGSDTLATARALAEVLRSEGPFDVVLLGRNSIDGETGQVGPEVAQLLDVPFASGVRTLDVKGLHLTLGLEHDDGTQDVELDLPAVVTTAERLCDPCKVDPDGRAAVPAQLIRRIGAAALGPGPWGETGSPTRVGATRTLHHRRAREVLVGTAEDQVGAAVDLLERRGALSAGTSVVDAGTRPDRDTLPATEHVIVVVAEDGRPDVTSELTGAAAALAPSVGASVHVLCPIVDPDLGRLAGAGADLVVELAGSHVAEDVADAVVAYMADASPWAVLAPSTAFGREVAARAAAATGSGLVGDAVAISVSDGELVAAKPAFAGALVADITCRSRTAMVTVRPGMLPVPGHRIATARSTTRPTRTRGRVRVVATRRDDDVEALARADVVIGVGTGVLPEEYERLSPLAALLGAELAATRKVTDKGWAPRARQVGITGRSIAPRLYVAIGLSGKFNHMVGVRAAATILAVNGDRSAPVFDHCDIGIVGDWHDAVPLLHDAIRARLAQGVVGAGAG